MEFLTPLKDTKVMEKETATLDCELSKADRPATWLKDGKEMKPSDRVTMTCEETKHFLVISDCVLDDESKYTIKVDGKESTAKLIVEGK